MSDVTRILNAIEQGNTRAVDQLLPLIYEELRLLAARKLSRERPGQTLPATACKQPHFCHPERSHRAFYRKHTHFCHFAAAGLGTLSMMKSPKAAEST